MDVPTAALWVPGVVDIAEEGDGCYRGSLKARVGPMSMTLTGTVTVEDQHPDSGRARFLVEASDRRVGGGVRTTMALQLTERPSGETEPVIRRKAQSTIEGFAKNLARELEGR
ncbi:hypothetical protein GBAR_LOCUS21094, partial [Geodia barretti]